MKSLGGEKAAILIQCTSEGFIIEEFRGSKVAILIQRTSEILSIEEFRGSRGSKFDIAHERKLDH